MQSRQIPSISPGTIIKGRYCVGQCLDKGGQGSIFEVDDLESEVSTASYAKVIKVVPFNPDVAEKLRIEAEKLSQFDHPGLPKVDGPNAYFEEYLDDGLFPYSFLVMEKIEGENLEIWLDKRRNKPIDEKRAIAWLKQLVDILYIIHNDDYLHRDIKPQNIILKPSDQLVLIDFGIAREKTESYYDKLNRESLTVAGTRSYQAPEQERGGACEASDFYSVGRTFIHLLTGIHPSVLIDENPYQLNWRPYASRISEYFADIIDLLVKFEPEDRLCLHAELLTRLKFIKNASPRTSLVWKELPWLLGAGLLVAIASMGIRSTGLLRPYEFWAYDRMLTFRPLEEPDPRLMIITIDEDDEVYQEENGMKKSDSIESLSDQAFLAILRKLFANPSNSPSIVGSDILHDFGFEQNYFEDIESIGVDEKIIYMCSSAGLGHFPPPGVPSEQIGFADLIGDLDDTKQRRHFLDMTPPPNSPCPSHYSLSTMLALYYLDHIGYFNGENGIKSDNDALSVQDFSFNYLRFPIGGYQNPDDQESNTILTNYRNVKNISEVGKNYSLRDFLESDSSLLDLKDKIVLIGVTQEDDKHLIPHAPGRAYGVFIHAHQLSQLISAILDGRPIITPWPIWKDSFFTAISTLLHSGFLWLTCSNSYRWKRVILISLIAIFGYTLFCYLLFLQAIWVGLVPAIFSMMSFSGLIISKSSALRKVVSETSEIKKIRQGVSHE